MDEKIPLKFQKLHLVSTLGWALILFLALLSRGVISSFAFWLIVFMVSILFVLDAVYFVTRVIEGHYLIVTKREVIMKRFLQQTETMLISDLQSIVFVNKGPYNKRIILSNGERNMEIKHIYKFSKENIIVTIQQSTNYPRNLEVTQT